MGRPAAVPKCLLTGPPKIGKSTVITCLVQLLRLHGSVVGGFVTNEQREHGRRVGFVIQDLVSREEAVIAHQDYNTGVQVGRFGVDVPAFERVGLPALRRAVDQAGIVVVDEIARMELASPAFVNAVQQLLSGPLPVVASIHLHADPFTDALKQRPDVEVLTVTEANRDALPAQLLDYLMS